MKYYDWIADLLNNTVYLLDIDNSKLSSEDRFKKEFYKITKGFSSGKDSKNLAKISTNLHNPETEPIEYKLKRELNAYKMRNKAIKNHVIAYLKMYDRKLANHYVNSYNSNMFNFYRSMLNKIESIEKEYPLEEE